MRPVSTLTPFIATLLLHAALVAAVVTGLSSQTVTEVEPLPVTVELMPAPLPVEKTPTAPAPAPPPEVKKRAEPVPPTPPKPARKPRAPATHEAPPSRPSPEPAPVPAPTPAAPATPATPAAPAAPAPAPSAPAPAAAAASPARTGVSIPATYAASNRKPPYPAVSQRYEEQGTVVLRVMVKADGTAGDVEIQSSSGYPQLDESARRTVRAWRFNPATSDGKPISEWYRLSVPFKLEN